jgi:hypothetical protein
MGLAGRMADGFGVPALAGQSLPNVGWAGTSSPPRTSHTLPPEGGTPNLSLFPLHALINFNVAPMELRISSFHNYKYFAPLGLTTQAS